MITVRDRDVFQWFWRLRTVADAPPTDKTVAQARELGTRLRHEVTGLYVDAPLVGVPDDLARDLLALLDAVAAGSAPALAAQARADGVLLELALLDAA